MKMSGDLVQVGAALEVTRGTALAPAYELHWADLEVNDKTMTSLDGTRTGILEDSRDLKVVGKLADGKLSMPVRDKTVGLFLKSLFGTVANSGPIDSAYTHTFSVEQSVQHASLCFHRKDPNGGYDYPLVMIDNFELNVTPDKHAEFSSDFRSKTRNSLTIGTFTITIATPGVGTLVDHSLATGDAVTLSTTGALPTGLVAATTYYAVRIDADTFSLATTLANALAATKITTSGSQSGVHTLTLVSRYFPTVPVSESVFLGQHATFKLATTQAGLDAAGAVLVRYAKLTIDQENVEDRNLGSLNQTDINNVGFAVKLEVQIVRNAETYVTALLAGTTYAARLDLNNTDVLIGTSSTPRLYFDLNQVILETANTGTKKGDLTLQTLVFKATYKEADSAMIKAYLVNSVATVI